MGRFVAYLRITQNHQELYSPLPNTSRVNVYINNKRGGLFSNRFHDYYITHGVHFIWAYQMGGGEGFKTLKGDSSIILKYRGILDFYLTPTDPVKNDSFLTVKKFQVDLF